MLKIEDHDILFFREGKWHVLFGHSTPLEEVALNSRGELILRGRWSDGIPRRRESRAFAFDEKEITDWIQKGKFPASREILWQEIEGPFTLRHRKKENRVEKWAEGKWVTLQAFPSRVESYEVLPDGRLLVQLEDLPAYPAGRNIFLYDLQGKPLWQIEAAGNQPPDGSRARPWSYFLRQADGSFVASWQEALYSLDLQNGKVRFLGEDK